MHGHITDEKGEYVKAAIVRLYKKCGDAEGQELIDEADVITYAETDEEGRFLIRDLDPEEVYFIEIHIDRSVTEPVIVEEEPVIVEEEPVIVEEEPVIVEEEPVIVEEEPVIVEEEPTVEEKEPAEADEEPEYDEDDRIDDKDIVDSLSAKTLTGSSSRETLCINCCCNYKAAADLKSKPYLGRTNLW